MMTFEQAVELVKQERTRQEQKWRPLGGTWDSDFANKLAILAEEFGEVAMALNDKDFSNMLTELVQVAAVAMSWLETDGTYNVVNT